MAQKYPAYYTYRWMWSDMVTTKSLDKFWERVDHRGIPVEKAGNIIISEDEKVFLNVDNPPVMVENLNTKSNKKFIYPHGWLNRAQVEWLKDNQPFGEGRFKGWNMGHSMWTINFWEEALKIMESAEREISLNKILKEDNNEWIGKH